MRSSRTGFTGPNLSGFRKGSEKYTLSIWPKTLIATDVLRRPIE
jgi:hypothetical protein